MIPGGRRHVELSRAASLSPVSFGPSRAIFLRLAVSSSSSRLICSSSVIEGLQISDDGVELVGLSRIVGILSPGFNDCGSATQP